MVYWNSEGKRGRARLSLLALRGPQVLVFEQCIRGPGGCFERFWELSHIVFRRISGLFLGVESWWGCGTSGGGDRGSRDFSRMGFRNWIFNIGWNIYQVSSVWNVRRVGREIGTMLRRYLRCRPRRDRSQPDARASWCRTMVCNADNIYYLSAAEHSDGVARDDVSCTRDRFRGPRAPKRAHRTPITVPRRRMDGARISRDAEAEHDGLRERPRALTTVSCNVCRTRKTRCGGDGREPCAFCSGRGLVCVYPARPAKRFAAAGSAQRGDETPTAQAPPPAAQLLPQPYSAAPPHSRYYAAPPSRPFGLGYGFAGAPQGLSAMPAPGYPSQSYRPMDSLLAAVQSSTAPLVPYPNYGRPGLAESFAAAAPHHPSAAELSSVHFSGHGALQGLESSLESDRTEMDQTFSAAPNEIPTEQQSARLAVRDLAPPLTDASRLPISWSDVATMSNTAVSVAPSTAVDPRRSVADLYPTIPPALLPRLDIILALIDLHMAYRNPLWNFIHTPTFKKRIELGTADPVLVLVVVWSGSFLVPKKLAAAGNGNHSNFPIDDDPLLHFDIDSKELEAECLRALSKQTEAIGILGEQGQADPAAVVSQLQALFIVRPILIHQGNISALTETMLGVEELFPHAKFGLLPADDYQARDPRNLASWIASEERARANAIYLMSDMARSAAYRTPCKSLPARPDAEQPWLDMPAPCPDLIFESLPPSPASAEDWIAWDARDRASGGILDSVRLYPIRHLISWVDQPKGSQLRESIVQFAMGGLLRNGLNAALPLIIDLWARVTVCMDVFSQHAFRIYDPPSDDSEDARRARELRSKIVAALDEFWEALPSEMRESGANSDHKALLEVAARWWGRTRQFTMWV